MPSSVCWRPIQTDVVNRIFNVRSRGGGAKAGPERHHKSGEESALAQPVKVAKKVGRNDPCPCGSGKKYKKCHGK